jgi:hypothetical protein
MNEVTAQREQENNEFGLFLLETIAGIYGCEPDTRLIAKYVYKCTDCGAWIRFDGKGIIVGTIIEGSEAEYSYRIDLNGIEPSEAGAAKLCHRFYNALDACEDFARKNFVTWD